MLCGIGMIEGGVFCFGFWLAVCVCSFDCLFEKGVEGWVGWMPLS